MSKAAYRLFEEIYPEAPPTQGIKYAGSKKKLLPQILWLAEKAGARVVLDGFAGSTRVSQALAQSGYQVICNDIAIWSEVFGNCYLRSKAPSHYEKLIKELNATPAKDGWFTEHYGGSGAESDLDPKMPWQLHNTRKLDGVREALDNMSLEPDEKNVALTSLILALDKVDNTLGHYCSYLRKWSARSFGEIYLTLPKIIANNQEHSVARSDIFDLAANADVDLAYYDPPYGSNNEKMPPSRVRYSAYYHVWTTICLNDKPELFGKVNRRADTRDTAAPSIFEEFRRNELGKFLAVDAVERLIRESSARRIILSYSSGGRATSTELYEAINRSARVLEFIEVDYRQNVMAGMSWTKEWLREANLPHREFLFLIEKH